MTSLSVITVIYRNSVEAVDKLLNAIRRACDDVGLEAQTIVVNNGDSCQVPKADLVVRGQGNVGFAAGNALGLKHAVGEWILFVNPDCSPNAGQLQAFIGGAAACAGISVPLLEFRPGELDAWAYANWTFGFSRPLFVRLARRDLLRGTDPALPRMMKAPGAAVMMRGETARELGPFDEAFFLYGEDRDMTLRARRQGVPVNIIRGARLLHEGGVSARTASGLVLRAQADAALRVAYRRYGPVGAWLEALDLLATGLVHAALGKRSTFRARVWAIRNWVPFASEAPALREADLLA